MYKIPSINITFVFRPSHLPLYHSTPSGQNFIFSLFIILIYGIFSIAFINNKIGLFY